MGRVEHLDEDMQVGGSVGGSFLCLGVGVGVGVGACCQNTHAIHHHSHLHHPLTTPSCIPAPQELVKLVNSKLAPGLEPLKVGALPHWQLSLEQLKNK